MFKLRRVEGVLYFFSSALQQVAAIIGPAVAAAVTAAVGPAVAAAVTSAVGPAVAAALAPFSNNIFRNNNAIVFQVNITWIFSNTFTDMMF